MLRVCAVLTIAKRSRVRAKKGQSTRTKIAHNQLIELLTRPNCSGSGTVHLSQPEGRVYDVSVEAVSAGFKVIRVEFGEGFTVRPAISA
jgi:hypothetical protein